MTANKPDKPGLYYWKSYESLPCRVLEIRSNESGSLVVYDEDNYWPPDQIGGIWLGPVHPYGESWTIPEWDNWTSYLARLGLDPMFQLGDPKHGIKAFTKRKGKVTE